MLVAYSCTWFDVHDAGHIYSREVIYATLSQGSFEENLRYRDLMG